MEQPTGQPEQTRPAPLPEAQPAPAAAAPHTASPAPLPGAPPAPAVAEPPAATPAAPPIPQPTAQPAAKPPAGRMRSRRRPTVGRCLAMLLVGLCPLVGIVAGILWGYGPDVDGWQRSLAKAMLILHGIVLGALVLGLALWVLMLLGGIRLY